MSDFTRLSDVAHDSRIQAQLRRMSSEQREATLQAASAGRVAPHQPLLPYDHLPVLLKQHGVAEAHSRPLVGRRLADDSVRSWRTSPAHAWFQPLVEWARTPLSFVALAFDVDAPEAIERLGAASMGSSEIPCPNLAVYRKLSGHAHAVYTLRRPVLRGMEARPFPLAALGRCSEWLLQQLRADAGFAGVLVSNPVHADYDTRWLRPEPYSLAELREYIPRNWRRPRAPRTDAGRNAAIFHSLMRYAGSADRSDGDVAQYAEQIYAAIDVVNPHAFTHSELADTLKSVLRYRARWRAAGWHKPSWLARQADLGRRNSPEQQKLKGRLGGQRSGAVRLERTLPRDQRILARLNAGESAAVIATSESVSRRTVFYARTRLVQCNEATNTDDPPLGGLG